MYVFDVHNIWELPLLAALGDRVSLCWQFCCFKISCNCWDKAGIRIGQYGNHQTTRRPRHSCYNSSCVTYVVISYIVSRGKHMELTSRLWLVGGLLCSDKYWVFYLPSEPVFFFILLKEYHWIQRDKCVVLGSVSCREKICWNFCNIFAKYKTKLMPGMLCMFSYI